MQLLLNTLNDNFLARFMQHAWKRGQLSFEIISNVEGPQSKSIGWGLHRKHGLRCDWFCNSFWLPEAWRYSPLWYIIRYIHHCHWHCSRFNPVLYSAVQLSNSHAVNDIIRLSIRTKGGLVIHWFHFAILLRAASAPISWGGSFNLELGQAKWTPNLNMFFLEKENHAKPFLNIYRPWSSGYFWRFWWVPVVIGGAEGVSPTLSLQVAAHADLVHQHRHQRRTTDFLRSRDTMETTFPEYQRQNIRTFWP